MKIHTKKLISLVNLNAQILEVGHSKFVDSLHIPFQGRISWSKLDFSDYPNSPRTYYINFLVFFVKTLYSFLVDPDLSLEKKYISTIELDYDMTTCIAVNNIDEGFIYVLFSLVHILPFDIGGYHGDSPFTGLDKTLEFILDEQRKLDPNPKPSWRCYFTSTPAELLDEFIPCFEENITDIPEDSIVWKTPYMINTMNKFAALKEYRKTLS